MEKHGKISIRRGKSCETQQFLGQCGQKCGMWEILHQKTENPMKNPGHFFGAVGPKMWKKVRNLASEEGTSCESPTSFGTVGPNMWQNVGHFVSEKAKDRGSSAQCRAQTAENCKVSKMASLEDTSREKRLRKHIAFWTTHEIAYLSSGEFNLPWVKNYIAYIYICFLEPNFEYVKNSLT